MKKWSLGIICIGLTVLLLTITVSAQELEMTVTITLENGYEASVIDHLTFGDIVLDPEGDTISLDASDGSNTATATANSSIENSQCGRIQVTSPIPVEVSVTYPSTPVDLSGDGGTIQLTNIASNSQYSSSEDDNNGVISNDSGGSLDIHVGGEIVLDEPMDEGTYSGPMPIIVEYLNYTAP
jgi:hypothetical protein